MAADRAHIVIPREVRDEALAKPQAYDAQIIDRMIKGGSIQISGERTAEGIKRMREQFRIDAGEAAALYLAKEKKWTIGIDDGPGIRAAKVLEVPFVTAIHVLIELYDHGLFNSQLALAKLESLEMWGRYHVQIIEDARSRFQKGR